MNGMTEPPLTPDEIIDLDKMVRDLSAKRATAYADGWQDAMRTVVETLRDAGSERPRLRGYCLNVAADFIERHLAPTSALPPKLSSGE